MAETTTAGQDGAAPPPGGALPPLPADLIEGFASRLLTGEDVAGAQQDLQQAIIDHVVENGGSQEAAEAVAARMADSITIRLAGGEPLDDVIQGSQADFQSIGGAALDSDVPLDGEAALAKALAQNGDVDAALPGGGDGTFNDALVSGLADGKDFSSAANDAQEAQDGKEAAGNEAGVGLDAADSIAAMFAAGDQGQLAGLDGNAAAAFANGLSGAGGDAGQAMQDSNSALATQPGISDQSGIGLSAIDLIAQVFAGGGLTQSVISQLEAMVGPGGMQALMEALANGLSPADALAEAQRASQTAETTRQASAVPVSAQDQAAASAASGGDMSQLGDKAGDFLNALGEGMPPEDALADANLAEATRTAIGSEGSVSMSPSDQVTASLASGNGVAGLAGGVGADATLNALAGGQSTQDAVAAGAVASTTAATTTTAQATPPPARERLCSRPASG